MKNRGKSAFIFFCIAPSVILFFVFMLLPTVNIFRMSLYKWGGYSSNKTFVGFDNFLKLSRDMKFLQSFQNTIFLILIVSIVTIIAALIFAALLTREKIVGQNFFRIVFYIPNILSIVIISAIFSAILDAKNGLLNSVLMVFKGEGAEPIYWLGDQKVVIYYVRKTTFNVWIGNGSNNCSCFSRIWNYR